MSEPMLIGALIGAGVGLLYSIVFGRLSAINRRLDRLSLLDAKVDALLKAGKVKFDPFENIPAGVRECLEHGETIEAIKQYRLATGVGLKEAKDFVDEIRRRDSASRSSF
jgi:hypothetical protein